MPVIEPDLGVLGITGCGIRARPPQSGADGEKVPGLLDQLKGMSELGISHVHGIVPDVWKLEPLAVLGREVVPVIADW